MPLQCTNLAFLPNEECARQWAVWNRVHEQENHRRLGKVSGHNVDVFCGNAEFLASVATIKTHYGEAAAELLPADSFLELLPVIGGEQVRWSNRVFAFQG